MVCELNAKLKEHTRFLLCGLLQLFLAVLLLLPFNDSLLDLRAYLLWSQLTLEQ